MLSPFRSMRWELWMMRSRRAACWAKAQANQVFPVPVWPVRMICSWALSQPPWASDRICRRLRPRGGSEVDVLDAGVGKAHLGIHEPVGKALVRAPCDFTVEHEVGPFIAVQGFAEVLIGERTPGGGLVETRDQDRLHRGVADGVVRERPVASRLKPVTPTPELSGTSRNPHSMKAIICEAGGRSPAARQRFAFKPREWPGQNTPTLSSGSHRLA